MPHAVVAVLTAVACVLLLLGAAFQVALAAGAPLAAAAFGGRSVQPDGRLPQHYRVASAITAVVLLGIGSLLLVHGGMLGASHPTTPSFVSASGSSRDCSRSTRRATSPGGIRWSAGAWAASPHR